MLFFWPYFGETCWKEERLILKSVKYTIVDIPSTFLSNAKVCNLFFFCYLNLSNQFSSENNYCVLRVRGFYFVYMYNLDLASKSYRRSSILKAFKTTVNTFDFWYSIFPSVFCFYIFSLFFFFFSSISVF